MAEILVEFSSIPHMILFINLLRVFCTARYIGGCFFFSISLSISEEFNYYIIGLFVVFFFLLFS